MKPYRTVSLKQGSPDWLAFRRVHVGSSDAPIIAGESPYSSPVELYADKTQDPDPIPVEKQRLFRIGHHMESLILDMYEEERGTKLRRGRILESRPDPWLSASLDAEAPGRIVEAKWTNSGRWEEGVPPDVVLQVTHQMAVADVPVADVAVLYRDNFQVHTVAFDEGLWDALYRLEHTFRWRNLAQGIPPAADSSESARRAISRIYPEPRLPMVEADAEVASLVRLIQDGKSREEAIHNEVEGFRNALRLLIGDHEGFEGPDFKVTYRKNRDSLSVAWDLYAGSLERVVGELLERHPYEEGEAEVDIAALRDIYTTTVPGPRVLRITGGLKG